MTLFERLTSAGISTENIIYTFQFKAGVYSTNGKRSYTFGSSKDPESFWGEIYFNEKGDLFKILPGNLLASPKSQSDFVDNALNDINGDHGYIITHRILFSKRPLRGKFKWKDDFRIKPCLNTSQIGKGLAWGIEDYHLKDNEKHLGPPYPFILEVRTKKSPNHFIETNRYLAALDFYEWLLGLLLPALQVSSVVTNGQPKWTLLQNENTPEYHLAYEAFNAHESEIETSENFSLSNIPDVPRYLGVVDYYNHFWFQSREIELPIEMEKYLNLFDSLPIDLKEKFRRSLYWFNMGLSLYNQNQLSIIPFTIAIECLLPNPSEVCPICDRTRGDGVTKLFNEFMEKNLSLPTDIKHLKKNIYPQRSAMVHGNFAVAADHGFLSIMNSDVSETAAETFIRRALVNWLVKGDVIQIT